MSSKFTSLHMQQPSIAFFLLLLCASSADPLASGPSSEPDGGCTSMECAQDDEALNLLQRSAAVHLTSAQKTGAAAHVVSALPPTYHSEYGFAVKPKESCGAASNAGMANTALIVPGIMIVLFAVCSAIAQRYWTPPSMSERASFMPRVTRVDDDGNPVHINWHFVHWSSIAIAMANVNYVVVLPAAVQNFGGSFLEAGVWVGLYACGAFIALPYFVSLGHHWSRLALVSHGLFTMIGNIIMCWGCYKQLLWALYLGRIVTGFAGSYKYSCDHGCLHLIPAWDRVEAIFITRMAYAVGFAVGPSISPICDWILIACPVLLKIFPTYNASAMAAPLLIMTVYGLVMVLASFFMMTNFEILDAATEGVSDVSTLAVNANSVSAARKWTAIRVFISTNVTNFTRIFIRVAWEAGALVTLVRQYCVGTEAGLVLSLTAITLVVSRNVMSKLSNAVGGDNSKLMRIFEWTGIVSCPFLFRIGPPTEVALGLFLTGSIIFYNSNSAQSGVLLALGSEVAIPGHRFLNKKALNVYYFISNISAYILGPITAFATQEMSVGQNTVAFLVVTITLIQVIITYTTVRPKQEIFAPEDTQLNNKK